LRDFSALEVRNVICDGGAGDGTGGGDGFGQHRFDDPRGQCCGGDFDSSGSPGVAGLSGATGATGANGQHGQDG
jgi:hypothetical protein